MPKARESGGSSDYASDNLPTVRQCDIPCLHRGLRARSLSQWNLPTIRDTVYLPTTREHRVLSLFSASGRAFRALTHARRSL